MDDAMFRLPISAFIICLNEERYLGNCIESLAACAEIVIVDSGSTDGTLALIRAYIDKGWPIRVFQEAWRGYAAQKQFAADYDPTIDRAFFRLALKRAAVLPTAQRPWLATILGTKATDDKTTVV